MKKVLLLPILMMLMLTSSFAQDRVQTGFDLVSTYVWRGVAFSGISVQPTVEYSNSRFAVGAWGSQGIDGFQEMDAYALFSVNDQIDLIVTDYYYPNTDYISSGSHAFELSVAFQKNEFAFSGYYVFAGEGSVGDDLYVEGSYSSTNTTFFVGAGNGWHSFENDFTLVNIGITNSREIKVSELFSVPFSSSVIFNPDTEQFYVLFGLSF